MDFNNSDIIRKLMDDSSAAVYVCDRDTFELLYVNEVTARMCGRKVCEADNDTCYHYLKGLDKPCEVCYMSISTEDRYTEREYYSEKSGRYYMSRGKFIDFGGRRALVEYLNDITDRVHSRKSVSDLLDGIPCGAGIFHFHSNGKLELIHLSDGYYSMLGVSRDDRSVYGGTAVLDAVHEDDKSALYAELTEAVNSSRLASIEARVLVANGMYKWVHIRARIAMRDSEKTVLYVTYTDIDKEKSIQLALTHEREILNAVFSNVIVGITAVKILENDIRFVFANERFYSILGYTKEQYEQEIGSSFAVIYPQDRERIIETSRRVNRTGVPESPEYRVMTRNGQFLWIRQALSMTKFAGVEGDVLLGVMIDISAERIAQKNELETAKRLKLLTDNVPGGIATYKVSETDVSTLYCNDGYCWLMGMSRDEFDSGLRKNILSFISDEDAPKLREQFREIYLSGSPINIVYRIKTDTGSSRWINQRGELTEREDGCAIVNTILIDITEQKQYETELKIHEEELMLAMSQIGKMICEYDPAKQMLSMPTEYAKRYNLPNILLNVPDCIIQSDIVDAESRDTYSRFFSEITAGEKTGAMDLQLTLANGEKHWEHTEFSSILDADNKPIKTVISIEDTTERHRQFEIEQSRPSLDDKSLYIHALFNLTTGETIECAYRTGEDVPIYDRNAFITKNERTGDLLIDHDEREALKSLLNKDSLLSRFYGGEREISYDCRRRMPDNEILWVRYIFRMLREPGGSDILMFSYCYVIEDEKLSELMYMNLSSDNYDYIARIYLKNKRYALFGLTGDNYFVPPSKGLNSDESFAKLISEHVHPEDRDMVLNSVSVDGIRKSLAEKDRIRFICRDMLPDGTIRYKRITIFYLDRQREIVVKTREDISALVQEERKKNDALAEALNFANTANRAKSQFLSRMSHELRTPMNAIIGLSTLAMADIDKPAAMEDAIGKISLSARYLLSLINDILEMSRIESGRMTLTEEPFDFEEFISGVNTIIYEQASAKDIDYDVVINSYIEPTYIGDATKLQQILVNVLGNAVKFTKPSGKITFAIEQLRRVNKSAVMRFVISDTGIGIDKDFIPHMFDAFSQESASFVSTSTGTGLGLAITKNLVEMMNGHISVQSIKNVGSTFTIEVRLGISEESRAYLDMVASMNLTKLRTMVVDDDVSVCRSTVMVLNSMGIEAEWIDSGARAIELVNDNHIKRKDYDTIFIDWKMPDMDGIETTRKIRKIVGQDVTIIIITAFDWKTIETEAREAGADMFMEKPLFQSSIVKAFERVFSLKKNKIAVRPEIKYDFSGRRILLAEDHPLNVEVVKRLVERTGAEVIVASNGLEAMEIFTTAESGYFDAILMDIRMPIMDGLTATRNIRNLKKKGSKTIPIIAMTANAFDEDVEMSLANGMNAHLAKPIDSQTLFGTLKRLMSAER